MKILRVVIVIAGSWCVPVAANQAVPQNQPTPGAVALLVAPKGVADVRMLTAVVGDADPAVRAVAARVAGLLDRKDLAITLLDLLGREQDITAASEQVRALLYLRGLEVLPQAKAAATRLGPRVGSTLAEWLARMQTEQFATALPDLLRDIPDSDTAIFGSLAALAVRQTPAARDRIATSLEGVASPSAWREFIDHLDVDPDGVVVKKGLGSSNAAIREATIWSIVAATGLGRIIVAADLTSAMNSTVAAPRVDDTEWSTFGRELLARRLGKAGATDGSETITRQVLRHSTDASALASAPELTTAERTALREVWPWPGLPSSPAAGSKQPTISPGDDQRVVKTRIRTFPSIASGIFGSLLAALHCELPANRSAFGAARVSYRPDGRPREIAVDTTTLKAACAPFVEYLARLTVAQPDLPGLDGVTQWLFISMDKETMDCADANARNSSVAAVGRERIGGRLKVPHKTKDVKPVYPESMRLARVAGVVIIQATITATGCVDGAEVLRSVQLPLDLAALKSVSGWRFEPTLLDGKPVPVIMTVTVNFTLQ